MSILSVNSAIDLNTMASSVYSLAVSTLTMAETMVGLETMWCRAIPHTNSEDVIILEYTLSNVECPEIIKVIPEKSDYQPGSFSVDLWGVSFEQPFEINVVYSTWNSIFGNTTAPLKGDIVYVKMYNRLYEVASSTIVYVLTSMPVAYKCTLRKYQRSAARREPDDIRISIDELTSSQDILFGDTISNEVADAVIERETSYNQSTKVDPIRNYDIDSIVMEDIIGENTNLISNAYYDFYNTETDVTYTGIEASYMLDNSDSNTHWIYTCWFRLNNHSTDSDDSDSITSTVSEKITLTGLRAKTKSYYEIGYQTKLTDLQPGDNITLTRGTLFNISGIIEPDDCGGYVIRIMLQDVAIANKKAAKWWETIKSGWYINKVVTNDTSNKPNKLYTLLKSDNDNINITTDGISKFSVQFGNSSSKNISLKKALSDNDWHYFLIDVYNNKADIKLIRIYESELKKKVMQSILINKEYSLGKISGFLVSGFELPNSGLDIQICNIRLYESEYPMGDNYKLDMYSQVTRNASKLILVDNPLPVNKMDFISPLK